MELPDLPDENIFDILSRLPVKSLMRFKCVSKPWCSLISDPQFIKAHFSQQDQMSSKMLVTTKPKASIVDYEDLENLSVELKYPIEVQTSKLVTFVGSCNGLVCLLLDSCTFILWNPSTREFRQVPPLIPSSDIYDTNDLSVSFYGFGYDSSIDDYKIVIGFWPKPSVANIGSGYFVVQCFSLETNEWKLIGLHKLGSNFKDHRGILLNKNLHWISEDGKVPVVLLFNIKEEKFIEVVRIPADCNTKSYEMRLYAFENSLFLYNSCRGTNANWYIELWEKNADAVEDSWKRLYHVRNQIFKLPYNYQLHFTRNYKLVLGFHMCGIRMYDLEAMTCKDFKKDVSSFSAGIVYRESLVSPN